jgi:SAM-dependent methyltransferase
MEKEIRNLMLELSKIDYHEPLPALDDQFLKVWGKHYSKIIHLIPHDKKSLNVLEVGVGYGVLALMLRRLYKFNIVATEHPSRGYIYAKAFRELMDREGVKIVEHDLHKPMPFNDLTFDMVLYCDVIEHLPPAIISQSLCEIKRVLKKDGCLVLSTPNFARLPNRIKLFGGRGINPPLHPRKVGETFDHIREFTFDEIENVLQDDFQLIKHEYGLIPFFNEKFNALNAMVFQLFPACGDELYLLYRVLKNV